MTTPKLEAHVGDATWWKAVALATVTIMLIVICIGLSSFISMVNPVAVEALALMMLIALGVVSVYVTARGLRGRR